MALLFATMLAACSATAPDSPSANDTAGWLQKACGVFLSTPVLPRKDRGANSSPPPGWTVWVDGTVVLAEVDVPEVLATLRKDGGLNLRGATHTRYSYQSPDARTPERECELDTITRQLYFRYAE